VGQVIKGKEEYGGGWLCWKSKGGCGAKWPDGAPEIEGQQVGDVENPDPYDLENTLVKMAKKRAHIDAALTGTASSDLFTQDLEEGGPSEREHAAGKQPDVVETSVGPVKPGSGKKARGAGAQPNPEFRCPHCKSPNVGETPDGHAFCRDCRKGI
jgi:hypothetical protein